jgi:hypothetical protein
MELDKVRAAEEFHRQFRKKANGMFHNIRLIK